MTPLVVFTLNELQKLVPSFKTEMVMSENEKVVGILTDMFWRLGCDFSAGVEVQTDVLSKNRFGEVDSSPRFILSERMDQKWLMSGYASTAAKQYTPDLSLVVNLWKLKNRGV